VEVRITQGYVIDGLKYYSDLEISPVFVLSRDPV
jgi:hypothetical protein